MSEHQATTTVVNIFRDGCDVYVGRTGLGLKSDFGNPYLIGKHGTRAEVIKKYRKWFYNKLGTDKEFKKKVLELKGQVLGCWCSDLSKCHATIIAEYLNNVTN